MEEYRNVHTNTGQTANGLLQINKSEMTSSEKESIVKFVEELRIGKAGKKVKDRRITNYLQFLLRLHDYFKKDLGKITEEEATNFYKDLQDNKIKRMNKTPYAQATKDEFIRTLKRYLGWLWGKENKKYQTSIRWMKEDYKESNKKAITLEEVDKILNEEKSIRNKCLFMFLFDSGARIEEALNVRIKDLKPINNKNKNYFMVYLRGQKTNESKRTIALPLVVPYLNEWLKEHPTKNEEDELFMINYDNARKIIRIMSSKVLKYNLKPHELRHSSATHYIRFGGFGAENIGGFYYRYGWKFGSKEALTYIKTYLYGGEIGQDKVVQAVSSDKMERMEKELSEFREKQKITLELLEQLEPFLKMFDKRIIDGKEYLILPKDFKINKEKEVITE